ncbi:hypothetical protein [Streptomyces sp. R41]|uniref:Uncharacterized protein n=1 Tax=Streptomyces sp. R41 TaxID=3238632 RepID=A0AB39RHK9_9ACTN
MQSNCLPWTQGFQSNSGAGTEGDGAPPVAARSDPVNTVEQVTAVAIAAAQRRRPAMNPGMGMLRPSARMADSPMPPRP